MLVDCVLVAEELYDVVIVIQATGLEFGTEGCVDSCRHLMLEFVPNANEETKVDRRIAVYRVRILVKAPFKLPIFVSTLCRAVEAPFLSLMLIVSIFDAVLPVVGVEHVGPCDVHEDDKHLRFEGDLRVIEDLNGCESRLT